MLGEVPEGKWWKKGLEGGGGGCKDSRWKDYDHCEFSVAQQPHTGEREGALGNGGVGEWLRPTPRPLRKGHGGLAGGWTGLSTQRHSFHFPFLLFL